MVEFVTTSLCWRHISALPPNHALPHPFYDVVIFKSLARFFPEPLANGGTCRQHRSAMPRKPTPPTHCSTLNFSNLRPFFPKRLLPMVRFVTTSLRCRHVSASVQISSGKLQLPECSQRVCHQDCSAANTLRPHPICRCSRA